MPAIRLLFTFCLLASCGNSGSGHHVTIETAFGDIEVELYPEKAPLTTEAFLKNIDAGVYENASFYRVVKAEQLPTDHNSGIIQGGIYQTRTEKQLMPVPHESTARSGLTHTDGTLSMARTKPGTATSEFFICIGDQSFLDSGRRGTEDGLGMAAFGKVTKGMKVVRRIQNEKSTGDAFRQPVKIINIHR